MRTVMGTRAMAIDPLRAGAALDEAIDRDEVFALVLGAARARLGFAALLSVHPDRLRGWRALADAAFTTRGVETLELPRSVPALEAAIATASPSIGRLATGDMFVDGLLELLGGPASSVLALPIHERRQTLAVVVGHRGEAALTHADVADLFPLAAAADTALARLRSQRARTAAPRAQTRADSVGYEIEVIEETGPAARASELRELVRDALERGDEDAQLELLHELGELEATALGRPEAAIEAWRSALTIDASDARVQDALEQLYAARGRWLDCVELIDKRVALLDDRGARIPLLLNLAAIARERLGDPARAIAAYERIVGWEPGHPIASAQLEALYRAKQEWGPVAAQMLDRASREPDARASLDALVEVARIYATKVGDPRGALLVWLAIARRDPTRSGLIDELEQLADAVDAELVAEASAIAADLEAALATSAGPMWQLVGRWARDRTADRPAAIAAFERALALCADDAERASDLHAELGELCEADPAVAAAHYEAALAGRPDAPELLSALHRLYLARADWAAIARVLPRLVDALAASAPVGVIVDLHVELGAVFADRLDRPDDAARAYQDALDLDPTHALARRSLAALYERTGQVEALLDATESEVDAASRDVQLARYADLAAAWHEHARHDRAAETWEKLIALDPSALAAHQGLARTLRAAERWGDLFAALRAQVRHSPGGYDKIVLLELAELQATRLDDPNAATATLAEILTREPDEPLALDAIARLHERTGRLRRALDKLERLLAMATTPHARADVLQRIGQVHLAGRDAAAARTVLREALALDRDHAEAREAMARVHLQQGELVLAGDELLRAARLHHAQPDVLRCLADAAWLYRYRLGDTERARECLHRILELDPAHADAKQALAELLHDNHEWASLWPHLEEQVRAADTLPAVDRRALYAKAARCAVELGKQARALELYDRALAVAPGADLQIERAEALYRGKALDAAVAALQAVAADAGNLERAQRIAVYRRLAQIYTELGRAAQAQQLHGKVLDLDPAHRDTLADLVELHLAAHRHDEAIASLRELAAIVEPLDRVALLERIGDLYRHQLANPGRAMSTYLDALEIDGGNRRILQRLLDLQTASSQWTRAVDTITKFLEHEADPARRAAYHLAAAAIREAELRDLPGAAADYERALDELFREEPLRAPTRQRAVETFQRLEALLTPERDWKALEQAYRRMIKRVPAGEPMLVPLWHALGELCRSRLAHPQSAIQAFEVAHALDPDKAPARTRILAELYAQVGTAQAAQAPAVVAAAAKLVAVDPTNPATYRTVAQTSLAAGRLDEAWCACRALVVLEQATFDEELLYKKYKLHEVRKARAPLDEAAWAPVRHPDEDRAISALYALIWEPLVTLRAAPAKSFELRAKERLPLDDDTRVVARIFRHTARVLAVALPEVYAQPRRAGGLLLANTLVDGRLAPVIIVGRDLMTGYRDTELAASIAAMVAVLRPAYYLKLAMASNEELEAALSAAALLGGRTLGRPELEPLTSVFVPALQRALSRQALETVRALVERLPDRPDVARWRAAVDAAAQRAALIVAGELEAVTRMLGSGGPRAAQRVLDLVAYSVSPGYLALRRSLGVAIQPR